jgi:hypothetical protein
MSVRTICLVALVLAAPVLAQCSNISGVTFTSYGAGCSAFGQDPPSLTGTADGASCTVTLNLSGWAGNCPNICLVARLLAFGSAQQQVPLGVVPCDLLVVPDFILSFIPALGESLVFPLPPVPLAGLTVFVQGGHDFMTPTGHQYQVSDGLQLAFY